MNISDIDLLVASLTVYGEARGSTQADRTAVAHTILNRAKAGKWWGQGVTPYPDHSLTAVCLKDWQFSCWNANDPNFKLLSGLQKQYREAVKEKACRACVKAVIDAIDGFEPDMTGGATHYLTIALHRSDKAPAWSKGKPFIEIGKHRFFTGIA